MVTTSMSCSFYLIALIVLEITCAAHSLTIIATNYDFLTYDI